MTRHESRKQGGGARRGRIIRERVRPVPPAPLARTIKDDEAKVSRPLIRRELVMRARREVCDRRARAYAAQQRTNAIARPQPFGASRWTHASFVVRRIERHRITSARRKTAGASWFTKRPQGAGRETASAEAGSSGGVAAPDSAARPHVLKGTKPQERCSIDMIGLCRKATRVAAGCRDDRAGDVGLLVAIQRPLDCFDRRGIAMSESAEAHATMRCR